MVKGVRRTTFAFPCLSNKRAIAQEQGMRDTPSGERTYTTFIIKNSFRKNALPEGRWCVSLRCDHEENPTSSRQSSKGFLHLDHRTLPQSFLNPGDRAAV